MPLQYLFATGTSAPTSDLDTNFQTVGLLGTLPCSVSGTNALTLTLLNSSNTPTVSAYANYLRFSFVATVTNTGAVTARVGSLAILNVYKDTVTGPVALVANDIVVGNCYTLTYDSTLNTGAGGFHLGVPSYRVQVPTRQVLTSGSAATYTTPAGCRYIIVRAIGGGGGGGGSASTGSGNAGGNGGDTIFNSVHAGGGLADATGGPGGRGGTSSTGTASVRLRGMTGTPATAMIVSGSNFTTVGGTGGGYGGGPGGYGGNAGTAGSVNTGGGGGSGGVASEAFAGNAYFGGGGSGEYIEIVISNPTATYTYTIGAGGTAGTAGTGGQAGAIGGTGVIIVEEFYS